MAKRLKIGLTGGIGSGKTAVSDLFAELGADVIDTDLLSRELVQPGQPALDEIVATFGREILDPNGRLDRHALRSKVFTDATLRKKLEAILHPKIREEMLARAARSAAPYVVFVIPLLVETGQQDLVDRVLLVDVPEALQRERVAQRDGLSTEQIDQILAAQADRVTRLSHADDIICNDRDRDALVKAVAELHRKYLRHIQD